MAHKLLWGKAWLSGESTLSLYGLSLCTEMAEDYTSEGKTVPSQLPSALRGR